MRRRRGGDSGATATAARPVNGAESSLRGQTRQSGDRHQPLQPTVTDGADGEGVRRNYDDHAWLAIFITALLYFIVTRSGKSRGVLSSLSRPYDVAATKITLHDKSNEEMMRATFYFAKSLKNQNETDSLYFENRRRVEVIISSPFDSHEGEDCKSQNQVPFFSRLASTTYVHDEDLGRGYLLIADVGRSGRIWRWEEGGGPITIGRSLHQERSGCRSGLWVENNGVAAGSCPENLFGRTQSQGDVSINHEGHGTCRNLAAQPPIPLLGSASLAVELTRNAEKSSIGKNLIVAEWGERRIVRVEGETGARTPLVTMVPTADFKSWRRLRRPNHVAFSPFGDLFFTDNAPSSNVTSSMVYRLKEAVHVAPISAQRSREAHGWHGTTGKEQSVNEDIDILFQTGGDIEGMALSADHSGLFILVTDHFSKRTIYYLQLSSEDGAEGATVFYSSHRSSCSTNLGDQGSQVGSKLVVDENGLIYFVDCPNEVAILSVNGTKVASLQLDEKAALTSVGFGEDGYIYTTTSNQLMRLRSRIGGAKLPTNLVPPFLKKRDDKNRRDKRDKQ